MASTDMSNFNVEGWTEVEAMNALQDAGGIISDECVMWEDVAAENQAQAIEWLQANQPCLMDPSPCRKCKTPIVFLKSKSSGKSVPVDASTIKGRVWFYDPKAGHISHFATCSSPELFRNK